MGWGNRPVLLAMVLLCAHALGDVRVGENTYPDSVDLSHLSSENKVQQGGSCHVHAAVSLFEAVCYQDTGEKVHLSEAYLFYRHLRETAARRGIDPTHVPPPGYGYTQIDGGHEMDTLRRLIASHSAIVDEDANPELFYQFLESWLEEERKRPENSERDFDGVGLVLWALSGGTMGGLSSLFVAPSCERGFAALGLGIAGAGGGLLAKLVQHSAKLASQDREAAGRFGSAADEAAQKAFGLQGEAPTVGLWGKSEDRALSACLERRWSAQQGAGTTEVILSLLSRGHPFVCSDRFDFGNVSGPHAALVLGYRFEGNRMQMLIHNADGKPPSWWNASECRQITVLTSEPGK